MFKIIKLIIIFVVIFVVIYIYFTINNNINILILGIDSSDKYTHHADTIMLIIFNPKNSKISFISIPRDTLVEYKGKRMKISEIYVYNFSKGGHKNASLQVTKEVERLLNMNIAYYIQTDYNGVKEIVDLLGGVRIKIENRMYYKDRRGGLTIDFKPGVYNLNGQKSIEYLRYRGDKKSDFGRIERQQKFLITVLNDCKKKLTIEKIPLVYKTVYKHMNTNISLDKVIFLFEKFKKIELDKIERMILPGQNIKIDNIYFWKPNYDKIDEMMKEKRK